MTLFSTTIPSLEIHFSKEPIALIFTPTGKILAKKIKPRGGYFVVYTNEVKGIFALNPRYKWMWAGTPCYFYGIKNTNPVDPVLCNELNKYCDKNKLTEIKRKDVRFSQRIRFLMHRHKKTETEAVTEVDQITKAMDGEMDNSIELGMQEMDKQLDDYNKQTGHDLKFDDKQKSIFLVEYLEKNRILPEEDKNNLIYKISNQMVNFQTLIEELKDTNVLSIHEPMDMDLERFLRDFGAQDPINLSGHIDDLRDAPKGLRKMTATPVKSFIPASVIFAIGLVGIMAIAILPGQMDAITAMFGDFKLPFVP